MELYPIIEPFVNYTKNKAHYLTTGSKKVASDLTIFAKNKARRMLAGDDATTTAATSPPATTEATGKDGADGAVVTPEKE